MISDYAGLPQLLPAAICVQVISQHAGLKECGAHLYTKSEKVVVTSGKGHYRLLIWRPLPATLTIEHQQYESSQGI